MAAPTRWVGRSQRDRSAVVAVEHPAETAKQGSFLASAAGDTRHGRDDAVGETAQGKRLEPHAARSAQRGEEQTLTAKQRGLDLADELDLVVDRRLERHDTAGIDADQLARGERALV